MMKKSGGWLMSGWRNGLGLDRERNSCPVITLKKEGYDPYIDYLKGVCIFFVILTHCLPWQEYMLFSLWGAQAVPLFLLIQTFHVYKCGMDKAVGMPRFRKLFSRIFRPFLIWLLVELFLLIVVFGRDPVSMLKSVAVSGGIGPGSYYVWIYVQFAFILPVLASLFRKLEKRVGDYSIEHIAGDWVEEIEKRNLVFVK